MKGTEQNAVGMVGAMRAWLAGERLAHEDFALAMEANSIFNALGFDDDEVASVLEAVESLTEIEARAWDDRAIKESFDGSLQSFMETSTTNYDVSRFCKGAILSKASHVREFAEGTDWVRLAEMAIRRAVELAEQPDAVAGELMAAIEALSPFAVADKA